MNKFNVNNLIFRFSLCFLIALSCINSAFAIENSTDVLRALDSQICWQVFWGANPGYKLGSTDPITIHQVGGVTYAWSYSMSAVPHVSDWGDFFVISANGGNYVVENTFGSNLDTALARRDFEKKLEFFGTGDTENLEISIPKDCTPKFENDTQMKGRMLDNVVYSTVQQLANINKVQPRKYPRHLKIIVSNFNADYPETFVLIPSERQVFVVSLFGSENLQKKQNSEYVVNQVYPNYGETDDELYRRISQKVMKYGIVREVNLDF